MTSTAPWRRMILHFSHIGFTDGRTFMVPFQEFGPVTRSGCRGSSRCYVTDGAHAGALRTRGQLKIAKRVRRRLDPNDSRTSAVRPWPRASDERVADAVDRGLHAVVDAQLLEHRGDVALDRAGAEMHEDGDLGVLTALDDEREHVELPLGEPRRGARRIA